MISYDEENRKNDAFATRTSYAKTRYPTLLTKRPVKNVKIHRSFPFSANRGIWAFEGRSLRFGGRKYQRRVGRTRKNGLNFKRCLEYGLASRTPSRNANNRLALQPLVPQLILEAAKCTIIFLYSGTVIQAIKR